MACRPNTTTPAPAVCTPRPVTPPTICTPQQPTTPVSCIPKPPTTPVSCTPNSPTNNNTHSCTPSFGQLNPDSNPSTGDRSVSGIWIDQSGLAANPFFQFLPLGKSYNLTAGVNPSNAFNPRLVWKSRDRNIVDVDNRGRITAKGLGFTIIEVSSEEKPNLKIDYRVQVIRNLKIYLSPENITTKVSPFDFYGRERDRMEEFAHHLHNYLKDNSCDVIVGDLTIGGNDRDIIERINQSNDLGADLHIALHSNGGGGFGPEIWYAEQDDTTRSEESLKLSNSIYNNLFSLYEKDFGTTIKRYGTGVVEYGTGGIRFAELRTPNLPIGSNLTAGPEAIPSYIEVAFHDTERDARWIINNMKSIAAVIGNGLLNYM